MIGPWLPTWVELHAAFVDVGHTFWCPVIYGCGNVMDARDAWGFTADELPKYILVDAS